MNSNLFAMYWRRSQSDSHTGMRILADLGYVTDGLFHAFDAEYNAGTWHDGQATAWTDMVTGVQLPYVGNGSYEWGPDYCLLTAHAGSPTGYGAFYTAIPGEYQDGPTTQDICRRAKNTRKPPCIAWQYKQRNVFTHTNGAVVLSFPNNEISSSVAEDWAVHTLAGFVPTLMQETTFSIYRDGEHINSQKLTPTPAAVVLSETHIRIGATTNPSDNYYGGSGYVYSCRVYDRELTAAEILQNYNADRARFGSTVS